MKNWFVVLITTVITAVLAAAGTYYFVQAEANKDKDNLQVQIDDLSGKLTNANTNTTATTWKDYKDSKYGFRLTLDESWLGYIEREVLSTSYQTSFLRFYMPTTDPSIQENTFLGGKYANILNIVVYTPSQWAVIQAAADADSKEQKATCIYLAQNESYVFAYNIPTITASDLAGVNLNVAAVAASFALDPNPTANWQTYTNSTYKLSFKYPVGWFAGEYTEGNSTSIYISNYQNANQYTKETAPSDLRILLIGENYPTPSANVIISQESISGVNIYSLKNEEEVANSTLYAKKGTFTSDHRNLTLLMGSEKPAAVMADEVTKFDLIVQTIKVNQ